MTTDSDAARIHASGTQGEQGAGLLARLAKLEVELEHWRSGRRVKGLPRIESVPDGIQYAARLARAIGTEGGEDHDALLAEAAQRMKGLHDAAAHLLQEAVVLRGRTAEAEVDHDKLAQDYARVMTERDNALAENARMRREAREWKQRHQAALAEVANAQADALALRQEVDDTVQVGICGDHMPMLLFGVPVASFTCDLPHGHEGWHGCEEGARWTQADPLTSADIEAVASRLAAAPDIGWEGCCRAAYESEGNTHDHPVGVHARRDDQ